MRRLVISVVGITAMTFMSTGVAVAGGGSSAVPAGTVEFDSCSATFVRSNSGIINETDRVCDPEQNPWTDLDVYLQFRPLEGRPNPECDPDAGLVEVLPNWSTDDPQLAGYFPAGTLYNVCIYLVDPVIATGSLDSADSDGINIPVPIDGRYRIDVGGTWDNTPYWLVDAEYVQQTVAGGNTGDTTNLTWLQGWPGLGEDFGDVLVDGNSVDWGQLDAVNHAYDYTTTITNSLSLKVSDTYYEDNEGALTYTLTFLGS